MRRLFRIATVVVATALLLPASGAGAESATPTNWKVAPHSGAGRLAGVSCFGPHACVAVGSVGDDEPTAIVERWNGSVRRADRNFRAGPRTWLNAVSCVSSTACVAVGGTAAFVFAPVIERWDGRRWRSQGVTVDNRSAELRGISCVAADDCMAVGADWYVDSDALAAHWDGHHWSPTPRAPLPRGAQSSFTAVSCPRRDFCTATGTLTYPNYAPTALIEHWDGRQWSIAWATPAGGGSRILSAVSCVDSAHCVAVGWTSSRKTGGSTPLLARWNGSGWRTVVNPALDSTLLHKGLTGVSCATTMSCVAVGTAYGRPSTRVRPLLATWDGTAWTTGSLPQRFGSSGVDQLDAVSCSVSHCAAVGAFHEGTDSNTLGWSGTVPRRSVDASWNAVDAARVRQLAAELRLTPAGLQKAAVYALAFVIGGASGPPTKVALPSGHTVATFTTVWDPSEFTIIDSVRERYGVDSSDATRIAVIVLSFVYALRGR